MNVEITHISVSRAARISAIISIVLALPMGLFLVVVGLMQVPSTEFWWQGPLITYAPTLAMLFVTLMIASLMGALVAVVYNFVAARWGGLRISMLENSRR